MHYGVPSQQRCSWATPPWARYPPLCCLLCAPPPLQPWAMTTVMFVGMSFCLPLAFWFEARDRRAAKAAAAAAGTATEPLLADGVRRGVLGGTSGGCRMFGMPGLYGLGCRGRACLHSHPPPPAAAARRPRRARQASASSTASWLRR